MKHLLNIIPTVKFRGQSSFVYRTILALLYVLPILFGIFVTLAYWDHPRAISALTDANDRLEKRHGEFKKMLADGHPEKEEWGKSKEQITSFLRTMRFMQFSWARLFSHLEEVLPPEVRLTRIRVNTDEALKLTIGAQAAHLEDMTALLRALYKHERFYQPKLERQAKVGSGPMNVLDFDLQVRYVPLVEGRP